MILYLTSDLHVDHYCFSTKDLTSYIDRYLPESDVLLVAGDTSDDPRMFLEFYRQASNKYEKIFSILGNHDLTVRHDHYFSQNPFENTVEKIEYIKHEISLIKNVELLDGNVSEYKGIKIGGCMGFCDFSQGSVSSFKSEKWLKEKWKYWYDGYHWRYMENNPDHILEQEMKKLESIALKKCDIIMTHFIPSEYGIDEKFKNEYSNAYFYFKGEKFISNQKDGCIWLSGHSHNCGCKIIDIKKKRIKILLNPLGYPTETNSEYNIEFGLYNTEYKVY